MERKRLKLPIGVEDFAAVRKGCYYVDKTWLIASIADAPETTVMIYVRPRRFGKSLLLSMLDCFFNENNSKDMIEDLFKGTEIYRDEATMEASGSRPIIRLNLKRIESNTYEDFLLSVSLLLKEAFLSLLTKQEMESFCQEDLPQIEDIIASKARVPVLQMGLYLLIKCVYRVKKNAPMVLLDEYDSPSIYAYEHGYYDQAQSFFKRFFGDGLKGNSYLGKAVITGITQLAHSSIFSDLNNPIVDNVLNTTHPDSFGFTEEEVKEALTYYGFKGDFDDVRRYYGGHSFNGRSVYNPWSILSFIEHGFRFSPYWAGTGEQKTLRRAISIIGNKAGESLLALSKGDVAVISLQEKIVLGKENDLENIFGLLVFSGYLNANEVILGQYGVRIPNEEIGYAFRQDILSYLAQDQFLPVLAQFKFALLDGDEEKISRFLKEYLLSTLSYYDFAIEKTYQIMVLTLVSLLFGDAEVKSEVNAGEGRCDIFVHDYKNHYGIIIEIKSLKGRQEGAVIEKSASFALSQIETKHYYESLEKMKTPNVYLYGMAFCKKKVHIKAKKIHF